MQWGFEKRAARLAYGVAAAALLSGAAQAATIAGESNGLTWTAQSTIIGQTATGTPPTPPATRLGPGGDPIYQADPARHSGTVALIMNYGAGGAFICSGSLMGDRRSIVTAGHCVGSGGSTPDAGLVSTTAYFWDYGAQGDERVPFNPAATAVDVTDYFIHEDYTGEVIDQNDIAVLTLADYAPDYAQDYELYTAGDLTGEDFNVAGYGGRSTVGGAVGAQAPSTGHLRQGDNRYDFRLGDDDFQGFWDGFFGTADVDYSYLSDFDNGFATNDASCRLSNASNFSGFGLSAAKYCSTGLGALEVGIAGGDSGGPGFIDGKLASVNSYSLTFGPNFGDFNPGLNNSWGEFAGYVPTFIHEKFIRTAMVPEPSTWALMIGGFGLAGSTLRRRRVAEAKA